MIKSKDKKFGKDLYILYPGDYYATKEDCILGTVAGSCMVVCLYDRLRKIGGMCHFIIPGAIGTEGIFRNDIAMHGITSMEYIMGEIVKMGGDRIDLEAKIFGSAFIKGSNPHIEGLSFSILKFIDQYFRNEQIPVVNDDLGGNYRRKIFFHPVNGKVHRKPLLNNAENSEFIEMEKEYIENAFRNKDKFGKVVIFE